MILSPDLHQLAAGDSADRLGPAILATRTAMPKPIKLPPTLKHASRLKTGKGWRLVNAKRTGSLKAALIATYVASGDRFVIFRLH
jgi:hypothetical protein